MPIVTFDAADVEFAGDDVLFGEDFPGPPDPGTSALEVLWNGSAVGNIGWDASGEEMLGGVGQCSFSVYDTADTGWEPDTHADVIIRIRDTGWRLFHGESIAVVLELPPGLEVRVWRVTCRDFNSALDERLVGAPQAGNYWRPSADEPYRPHDPAAISGGSDADTIVNWALNYLALPGAINVETSLYVFEYVASTGDPEIVIDEREGMTTLGSVVAQLAALADVNVQDTIDPDNYWHHQQVPPWQDIATGGGDLDDAPYQLWDKALDPDGTTAIGHGGISVNLDGQTQPEVLYVQGKTPAGVFDGVNDEVIGGSGWYPAIPEPYNRQAYLPVPDAWEQTRRDLVAAATLLRVQTPTLRGSVNVLGWMNPDTNELEPRDGWRIYQKVTITDARLPSALAAVGQFVIQRVGWSLIPGTRVVKYELGFGDGPVLRASQRRYTVQEAASGKNAPKPQIKWTLDVQDVSDIGRGESRELRFVGSNEPGEPGARPGMPVSVSLEAYDADENLVPGEGSVSPTTTTSADDGSVYVTLTASTDFDLDYVVILESDIAP